MKFSSGFYHSQPSVVNCVATAFQYHISRSKYVPYTLSLVMMQNRSFKVIFILPGIKNCNLLSYFGQGCSYLTFCG